MGIMERFRLNERTALVTGSSRGIGRAIALTLAEFGAVVAVHGAKQSEALAATLADVRRLSPRSVALTGDLADPAVPAKLVIDAARALGSLDILVVNASVQIRKPWLRVKPEEALLQMQVNFHASLSMMQVAAPVMQARRWGRILVVGSVQEHRPHPEMPVYAASKSALENLVRNLAKQLGPSGVTVNNLSPGVVTTDRNAEALSDAAYAEQVRQRIPLACFAEPEDCAGTALLLCSEAGRYITGETVCVDGGLKL